MSFWDDILGFFDSDSSGNSSTIDFGQISNVVDFGALEGNTLDRFLSRLDAGQLGRALGGLFTNSSGGLNTGLLGLLGGAGIGALGLNDPNIQRVGYTGGIPRYTAVRERVPTPEGPNPQPGARGRRYFSDTYFAKPEDTNTPTEDAARQMAVAQAQQLAQKQNTPPPQPARDEIRPLPLPPEEGMGMATGGIAALAKGRYLAGATDGMEDRLPATIEGKQAAKLSHGEFVVPADVVSHLGNGNSEAGAKQLYAMMDRIRQARTGTKKQGKQINPKKYLPK